VISWSGRLSTTTASSGLHRARSEDAQVGAGAAAHREALDPALLTHGPREGRTRDARTGHLEADDVADGPDLSDEGAVDVEAGDGEVLAERSGREVPTHLGSPVRELVVRDGIHRLVGAAMVAPVADEVLDHPAPEARRFVPGVAQVHGSVDGRLVYAGRRAAAVPVGSRAADVDGEQVGHARHLSAR